MDIQISLYTSTQLSLLPRISNDKDVNSYRIVKYFVGYDSKQEACRKVKDIRLNI